VAMPGVAEAFAEKGKIQIVVSSVGDSSDKDNNHLWQAMTRMGEAASSFLQDKEWRGDLGYRPYSDTNDPRPPGPTRAGDMRLRPMLVTPTRARMSKGRTKKHDFAPPI